MSGVVRSARRPWLAFFGLAAVIVVADQLVKAWAVPRYPLGETVTVFGDFVRISMVHNTGALFGLFRDQVYLFAAGSVVVIALIVWFHGRAVVTHGALATVALGLLLGGAVGNLIDRLTLGYVLDFVDVGIGTWRWYTFNVADASISASLGLLVLMAFLPARRPAGAVT